MKEFISPLNGEAVTAVSDTNSAKAVKSGSLPVFATPMMISLMEEATCYAVEPLLDDGETTVGTSISVSHDKASGIGAIVTANATLEEVDGRRLVFSVVCKDDTDDIIGKGKIERFVVSEEKFMKRVNKK